MNPSAPVPVPTVTANDQPLHNSVPGLKDSWNFRASSADDLLVIPPLKEMLRSPMLLAHILTYAKKNYQDEGLLFWMAIESFEKKHGKDRLELARSMAEEFLSVGGEHEVTVDANEKQRVMSVIENGTDLDSDLFAHLKLELENVMNSNVYSEYSKNARRHGSLDFAEKAAVAARPLTPQEIEEERQKGARLMENLVIEPDNFSVLFALCQVFTILESHEEEERAFLRGVVEILLQHSSLLSFLSYVVRREVDECTEVNTLFRGRTVFTLLLNEMLRRRPCARFLADICKPTLAEVQKLKVGLVTDATRLEGDTKLAVSNAERLVKIVDALVERIANRYPKCPPTLRKTFELLSHVTGTKFPHLKSKIVGAVFFLRFINPALSQPEKHDLVSKEIPMFQRKVLVQAAKMLQFVTNDSRFEEVASREAHEFLNQWINGQILKMEDLFARLTSVNESDWEASDISSPSPSLTPTSGSPTSSLSPRSPKGSISGVPASSPRENSRFSAKLLAQKLVDNRDKLKSKFSSSEQVLGESLTPEQSQVLRLRVLDTLIKHQARVKELLSSNMNTMTQWMWLKEALQTLLQ